MEKVSSPKQLSDDLRVTNPGVWAVLAVAALLLVRVCVGTLNTAAVARIVVENRVAYVAHVSETEPEAGMPLRMAGREMALATVTEDACARPVADTETTLPDGSYDGVVVIGTVPPRSAFC